MTEEQTSLNKLVLELRKNLDIMNSHLNELIGVENRLYYEIIVKGLNVTRAVDKVSVEYDKDVSTIWKHYYPKVKLKIDELENGNLNQ